MVESKSIEPKWVLVDQTLYEVSDFAHLSPRNRPNAICPVCQCSVILKLGNHRVHHYAHRPEDKCTANQPETALHLNMKFYIYKQLLQTRKIYTEDSCEGYCGAKRKQVWLEGWDRVDVEFAIDSFRPDIALMSKGKVIGAIEILVTHPVSEQKARYFNDQGFFWIEVRAKETLYEGDSVWTAEKPLPFTRCHPQLESWKCASCREIEEKRRAQREYEQNNYETIHSAKMVDFYFKSGKKYREVYFVMKEVKDKTWVKAWVKTEKNITIASENAPITRESLQKLNEAVKRKMAEREGAGAIVDEVIKWRLWEKGQKFVARDTDNFPFRYFWDEGREKWTPC